MIITRRSAFYHLIIAISGLSNFFLASLSTNANSAATFNASDDFIQRIRPLTPLLYQGVPDSAAIGKTCSIYHTVFDQLHGWLLIGHGSGQVWTLDSARNWVRQDSTDVFGYNFNCSILPGPMKYGGYGLWKSNGMLIAYSWAAREWETRLLSREIHAQNPYNCFYDQSDSSLYQLGIDYSNAALKNQEFTTDSLYKLKLRTGEWTVLGRFSTAFQEPFQLLGRSWPSEDGLLIRLGRGHEAVYVDFKAKTFRSISEDIVVKLWAFDQTNYIRNKMSFSTAYGIYSMDPATYELLDSLSWQKILETGGPALPLLEPEAADGESKYLYFFGGIGIAGVLLWWSRKKRNRRHISEFIDPPVLEVVDGQEPVATAFLLERSEGSWYIGGRPILELTPSEMRLMELLVEKQQALQPLSTQQMNEILGIDQRTVDSQKKTRSEVIRHINKCFNDAGYRGEAVQRSRQEDDRRAVSYVIAPDIRIESGK
ncbi:MAG: hypothetical protein ACKO1U_02225 [Bacteroidota bacterium]